VSPIVCIYCKETRDRPARGEHVVLEALGGNTTIADVCGGRSGCNQKFGDTIDRELLRNSLVTLHRLVVPGGGDHEQQMFFPREDHGVWLDVLVRPAEQDMSVLPQLYLHDGGVTAVASPEFDSERLRLASSTFADLGASVRYIQDIPQYSPRIVLQTWRRRLILRARSSHEAEGFLEVLREKLPRLAAASNEGSTDVTLPTDTLLSLPLSTSMNDGPRCAAKMAFNFLSLYCGPEVALQAEFDSVRDYITGRNVEPVREIVVGDEIGLTIDTRHVANWAATDMTASPWNLLRDAHYICLSLQEGQVCAEVGLFGGRCRFLVRLGKATEGVLRGPLPAVFLSPIGGGGDRVLAGNELHEALHRAGLVEPASRVRPDET